MRKFFLFFVIFATVMTASAQQPQLADSATAKAIIQKHVASAFPTKMPYLVLSGAPQYMNVTKENRENLKRLYVQRMYTSDGGYIDSDYEFREGDVLLEHEGIPFQSVYTSAFLISRDISASDAVARAKQIKEQQEAIAEAQKQTRKAQRKANKKPLDPQAQQMIMTGVGVLLNKAIVGRQGGYYNTGYYNQGVLQVTSL